MEKFAVDLDKVLDELEQNDDVNDLTLPTSLVSLNTSFTNGISSWTDEECINTSVPTQYQLNNIRKISLPSYIESQAVDKISLADADFGINIKDSKKYLTTNKESTSNFEDSKLNNSFEFSQIVDKNNEISLVKSDQSQDQVDSISDKIQDNLMDEKCHAQNDDENDNDFNKNDFNENDVNKSPQAIIPNQIIHVEVNDENVSEVNLNKNTNLQEIIMPCKSSDLTNLNLNKTTQDEIMDKISTEDDLVTEQASFEDNSKQSIEEPNENIIVNEVKVDNFVEDEDVSEENLEQDKNEPSKENVSNDCDPNLNINYSISDKLTIEKESLDLDSLSNIQDHQDAGSSDDIKYSSSENIQVLKFEQANIDDLTEDDIDKYLSDIKSDHEKPQNEMLQNEMPQNEILQNEMLQNEMLQNEMPQNEKPQNEIIDQSDIKSEEKIDINNDEITSNNKQLNDFENEEIDELLKNDNENVSNEASTSQQNISIEESVSNKLSRPTSLILPSNINTSFVNTNQMEVSPPDDHIDFENNINPDVNANVINEEDLQSNDLESPEPQIIPEQIILPSSQNHIINNRYDELANRLTVEEQMLGKIKPIWVPDQDAQTCMHCDMKFTVIKRRHHCRACGKLLCANCCNQKAKLIYLENKEARVCQICYSTLMRVSEIEQQLNDSNQSSPEGLSNDSQNDNSEMNEGFLNNRQFNRIPDPNNPAEYCSTIPPLEQAQANINRPPLSVMVPVGVLKRADRPKSGEPKQVKFSDGIRPGDMNENFEQSSIRRKYGRMDLKLKSPQYDGPSPSGSRPSKLKFSRLVISDVNGPLPHIINASDFMCNSPSNYKPSITDLIDWLKDKDAPPIVFALTKNLHIIAKIVKKNCCVQNECWTFTTKGLATIGQDEIMVLIECLPDEDSFPRDIFRLFTTVYDSAFKGNTFSELNHIIFHDGLFGNPENSGFLFIRPTLQCFNNLVLPSPPFLVALLFHKFEIPWIKVFPLRLILRLGAEYRYYPCPIISYRFRKPAYYEIGHTIMNVLADFRNYQYSLTVVPGLVIHLQEKRTTIFLPRNRFDKVLKVLHNSNEHVLPFGANFSMKADSHLVCIQNDDGQYQTQAINIENAPRSITGASFIVFSGALKSTTGLTAKMSIVEDGLLVQIPASTMIELRNSLKEMKDYVVNCGKVNEPVDETITLTWAEEDTNINLGVRSPIDGSSLERIQSVRIHSGTDYANSKYLIRWTEIFFLQFNENDRRDDNLDPNNLAETIAQSLCLALTSNLESLYNNGFTKIGLRVNLDPDKVGYEVGSKGTSLPSNYTKDFDAALIPVIMDNIANGIDNPLVMELIFHILVK